MTTPDRRLQRELRGLRAHALASTAVLAVLGLGAFRRAPERSARFDTLTVERINVVETDGRVRLVISNRGRSPGQVMRGKRYAPDGQRGAGLTFYNDFGDENGGLVFGGSRDTSDGGRVSAGAGLMFDQFQQDQVVALQYTDERGRRSQGLTVLDRPEVPLDELMDRDRMIGRMPAGPAKDSAVRAFVAAQGGVSHGAPRLFVGRNPAKQSVLDLKDRAGRSRLRLAVDSLGAARIAFLNDSGRIVRTIGAATP